jgi:hypothetical protein
MQTLTVVRMVHAHEIAAGASKTNGGSSDRRIAVHLNWTHAKQVNLELVNLLGRNSGRGRR